MSNLSIYKSTLIFMLAILFLRCEMVETCASCLDPDLTVFVFDTTATGFRAHEIDSFYIIGFSPGQLDMPSDTSDLLIEQNPFFLSRDLFGTSTLNLDYVVVGINQEFRFEISDLDYTIRNSNNNCNCDIIESKSLRINGDLISLTGPFQSIVLRK